MLIGYARVSTQDQNLELQREALTKAGCQKVFEDKVSGARADRPGLARAQEMLREGDTLVVWKLNRHCRRTRQVKLVATNGEAVDCPTPVVAKNELYGARRSSTDRGTCASAGFSSPSALADAIALKCGFDSMHSRIANLPIVR